MSIVAEKPLDDVDSDSVGLVELGVPEGPDSLLIGVRVDNPAHRVTVMAFGPDGTCGDVVYDGEHADTVARILLKAFGLIARVEPTSDFFQAGSEAVSA